MKISLRNDVDLQAENLHGWLLHGKSYVVLSVEQYSSDEIGFRVASEDSGQPVVFRASLFDVIDSTLPKCWKVLAVRSTAIDLGPEPFGQTGFWEKCFDRDPVALNEYLESKEQVMGDS
ncbi:hypothetical protein [Denitromonas sp.]|uniref:hypothetical protein n=1 Tax=Denitromonas sp. TaxID=2734609 RepID=UPI002AFDD00A|nr:hypothetical protein [Denitromonas sp.]